MTDQTETHQANSNGEGQTRSLHGHAPTQLPVRPGWFARLVQRHAAPAVQLPVSFDADSGVVTLPYSYGRVIDRLSSAIWVQRSVAGLLFALSLVALIVALVHLPNVTANGATAIKDNPQIYTLAIYELIRVAGYAAFATAAVWGLFNLGRAALDQATRYEKRLVAAHFLHYTLETYSNEIRSGKIKITEVMTFLKSWSENVESAYTHVKFGAKGSEDFAIAATKDGVYVAKGSNELKMPDAGKKE